MAQIKKLFISSMFIAQIATAEFWLTDTNHQVAPSSTRTLHRKLKHTKISARDSQSHPVHLRHILDQALNHGPVKISVQDDKIKVESSEKTYFVKLPADVKSGKTPFTLWYMEHGEHQPDKHYSQVDLPATLTLKK